MSPRWPTAWKPCGRGSKRARCDPAQAPSRPCDRRSNTKPTVPEPGFPPQQAWLHDTWQPDPLVLDDQALILNVRDKGLVVLTGCGHAGVLNSARYAQRLGPVLPNVS
jgi:hypothetical protein